MEKIQISKKKILVELLHGIGDTVCSVPMLRLIRECFPNDLIDVLIKFESCKMILQCSNIKINHFYVQNIYSNIGNSYNLFKSLRMREYDYLILDPHTPVLKGRIFANIVNPKEWFGLQKTGLFFDTLPQECHHVEAYQKSIISLIKKDVNIGIPKLKLDVYNFKFYSNVPDGIVGICIGNADYSYRHSLLRIGKVYTRGWGIEKIKKLICKLISSNICVLLLGGKQEEKLLQKLDDILSLDAVVNMVGKTNIIESMYLAKKCACLVGVDTGMLHIASAVGTPVVGIFGPTNPLTHGPLSENFYYIYHPEYCNQAPCYGFKEYTECKDRVCMSNIKTDEVYNAVMKYMNR